MFYFIPNAFFIISKAFLSIPFGSSQPLKQLRYVITVIQQEYINIVVSHLNKSCFISIFMKLQKVKAREYKGKPIYKYIIVIPPKDIDELGWMEGIHLEGTIIKDKGYFLFVKN